MAAALPNLHECKRILVKNIPFKSGLAELTKIVDKLTIHFQKQKHGGQGNIASVTFPKSNLERSAAVIEFYNAETVESVLQHQPHHFNGQDLVVTQYICQGLEEADAKVPKETVDKLSHLHDLREALILVENTTGVNIEAKGGIFHVQGQWYQVAAAAERLEDLLSGQFWGIVPPPQRAAAKTKTTSASQDGTSQAHTNNGSGQSESTESNSMKIGKVAVDRDISAYVAHLHPTLITAIQKKYKVIIEEDEEGVKIRPNEQASKPDVIGAEKTLSNYHYKYSGLFKSYVKLKDFPGISSDEIDKAITSVRQTFPKVLITKDTNKKHRKEILFLSSTGTDSNEAVLAMQRFLTEAGNKEVFSHTFPRMNFAVSVICGTVWREKVDAIVAGLDPACLDAEPMVSGGEKMKQDVQSHIQSMKQRPRDPDEVIRLDGSNGSLQCKNILLFLDDANPNATFDLKRSLLKLFEYVTEKRFQKISLVMSRLGLNQSQKDREETVLAAVFVHCKNVFHDQSASESGLELRLLYENETDAKSLVKKLKEHWIPNFKLPVAGASAAGSQAKEQEEECAICLESLAQRQSLKKLPCGHVFHQSCIDRAFSIMKKCPLCLTFFGRPEGNQPKSGTMTSHEISTSCEGYHCPTIEIHYYFPNGVQGPEHPNPGKKYYGTHRKAYLPSNKEGREALLLLRKAFDARLTFTVGRSVTTGLDNCVTWNDIHHKTNMWGGSTSFGYPDATYLTRLKDELKSKGIE